MEVLFTALCFINRNLFVVGEATHELSYDYLQFVQNRSRAVERESSVWISRRRTTRLTDEDVFNIRSSIG